VGKGTLDRTGLDWIGLDWTGLDRKYHKYLGEEMGCEAFI
jgi:hypothetical protein